MNLTGIVTFSFKVGGFNSIVLKATLYDLVHNKYYIMEKVMNWYEESII